MKSHNVIVAPFIFLAALGSVVGSSEVMESSASYPCCESPTIAFSRHCETSWSISDTPIAYSNGSITKCASPCKKIERERMTMDGCPAFNATEVCTSGKNVAKERRIHYYGQPCSGSLLAPGGSVGLLLAVVIGGLIVKMIC